MEILFLACYRVCTSGSLESREKGLRCYEPALQGKHDRGESWDSAFVRYLVTGVGWRTGDSTSDSSRKSLCALGDNVSTWDPTGSAQALSHGHHRRCLPCYARAPCPRTGSRSCHNVCSPLECPHPRSPPAGSPCAL